MSFSQEDLIKYPRTVFLNSDTITMFKFSQAKQLAREVTERDFLFEENKILVEEIGILKNAVTNLKKQISVQKSIIEQKDLILTEQKSIITKQEVVIKGYEKKERIRKIRNGTIAGAIVTGLITIIILK